MSKSTASWSHIPLDSGLSKPYPNMNTQRYLKHYPQCKNEITDLSYIIDRQVFTDPIEDWSKYYVRPTQGDIDSFIDNQAKEGFDEVANELVVNELSDEVLGNFIRSSKPRKNKSKRLSYIVGPPGCGKSTFIKYSMLVHLDKYYENKLIPMRLSLTTLQHALTSTYETKFIEKKEIQNEFNKLIYECITRDWVRYLRHNNLLTENYLEEKLLPLLNNYQEANIRLDYRQLCSNSEIKHNSLSRLTDPLKVALTYDMFSAGFTPQVMIDGFDYIGAFNRDRRAIRRPLIAHVQDIELCFNQLQNFLLEKFRPHGLVLQRHNSEKLDISFTHIIRNETYATYNETESLERVLGNLDTWFVAPPNQGHLIRSRISRCNNGSNIAIPKETLDTISMLVSSVLTCHVNDAEVARSLKHYLAISNYNCRSYLMYTYSLFSRTLYEATLLNLNQDTKQLNSFEKLITFIHEVLVILIETKPYFLKECLILGHSNHFENHYLIDSSLIKELRNSVLLEFRKDRSVPQQNIDFTSPNGAIYLKDVNGFIKTNRVLYVNPRRTGVIDNIFNYLELPSLIKHKKPPFLVQLHLLLYMSEQSQENSSKTSAEILDHAQKNGYETIDEVDSLLVLNQLTHEGLLNKNRKRNDLSTYSLSIKGSYLLQELSQDFTYVTVVMEHMLLPDPLRKVMQLLDSKISKLKLEHPDFPDYRFSQLLKSYLFFYLVQKTNKLINYGCKEHNEYFSKLSKGYDDDRQNILKYAASKLNPNAETAIALKELKTFLENSKNLFKNEFNSFFK